MKEKFKFYFEEADFTVFAYEIEDCIDWKGKVKSGITADFLIRIFTKGEELGREQVRRQIRREELNNNK